MVELCFKAYKHFSMVVMAYSSLYHNDTWHRILNVEVVIKMKVLILGPIML